MSAAVSAGIVIGCVAVIGVIGAILFMQQKPESQGGSKAQIGIPVASNASYAALPMKNVSRGQQTPEGKPQLSFRLA